MKKVILFSLGLAVLLSIGCCRGTDTISIREPRKTETTISEESASGPFRKMRDRMKQKRKKCDEEINQGG